jgi:hypothetical protein
LTKPDLASTNLHFRLHLLSCFDLGLISGEAFGIDRLWNDKRMS